MKKTNNLLLFLLTSFVSGSFVVAKNPSNNKDLIESCHKKCKQIVKKLSTNIEGFKLEWQEKFNDSWKILNDKSCPELDELIEIYQISCKAISLNEEINTLNTTIFDLQKDVNRNQFKAQQERNNITKLNQEKQVFGIRSINEEKAFRRDIDYASYNLSRYEKLFMLELPEKILTSQRELEKASLELHLAVQNLKAKINKFILTEKDPSRNCLIEKLSTYFYSLDRTMLSGVVPKENDLYLILNNDELGKKALARDKFKIAGRIVLRSTFDTGLSRLQETFSWDTNQDLDLETIGSVFVQDLYDLKEVFELLADSSGEEGKFFQNFIEQSEQLAKSLDDNLEAISTINYHQKKSLRRRNFIIAGLSVCGVAGLCLFVYRNFFQQ